MEKRNYTEEELMARLKFIIGLSLVSTLVGIIFVILYSIIFVTQPLDAISPIDQKFFELIVPVATFLTGTLSGIMLGSTKTPDQTINNSHGTLVKPTPPTPKEDKEVLLDKSATAVATQTPVTPFTIGEVTPVATSPLLLNETPTVLGSVPDGYTKPPVLPSDSD